MKIYIKDAQFTLFGYANQPGLHVAIPANYLPFIEQAEHEYGSLNLVPADKTVQGIFIKANGLPFDEAAQQNDVTMNRLIRM